MSRLKLYTTSTLLLIATVPWLFFESSPDHILGFPAWAFWSFITTVIYTSCTAFFFHKYWSLSARGKNQVPRAKNQEPSSKFQEPRAKFQEPRRVR